MMSLRLLQSPLTPHMRALAFFDAPQVELTSDEHGQPAVRVEDGQVEFVLVFPHLDALAAFVAAVEDLRGALLPDAA